jgi:hypothetical protein
VGCLVQRAGLLLLAGGAGRAHLLECVARLAPGAPAAWVWRRSAVRLRFVRNRLGCAGLLAPGEATPRTLVERGNVIGGL